MLNIHILWSVVVYSLSVGAFHRNTYSARWWHSGEIKGKWFHIGNISFMLFVSFSPALGMLCYPMQTQFLVYYGLMTLTGSVSLIKSHGENEAN